MKKLLGILSVMLVLFSFSGKAEAISSYLDLHSYYDVEYYDGNFRYTDISYELTLKFYEEILYNDNMSGTFYQEYGYLTLAIRYNISKNDEYSELAFISIYRDLPFIPYVSGYCDSGQVFYDEWEMTLKNNYEIRVPYDIYHQGEYELGHYYETVGIEATLAFLDGKLNVWYSVSNPFDDLNPSPTPIPAAALLIGTGLSGLALLRRKMK